MILFNYYYHLIIHKRVFKQGIDRLFCFCCYQFSTVSSVILKPGTNLFSFPETPTGIYSKEINLLLVDPDN